MLQWTLDEVAAATGGTVHGDGALTVTSVSTDSRAVAPGSLFVARRGEHFDGHLFVAAAVAAGAAAAVVDGDAAVDLVPRIEVSDTAVALRDLGAYRRRQLTMPVVAVTGSTGKTSTKDLLAAAIPGAAASPRSYNNEVGVPLSVLGADDGATALVLEVGSRGRGHIAWLMPALEPDVAVITNIGVAHLETFATVPALVEAKWELVQGLGAGGTAVLPADDPRLRMSHGASTVTFGGPGADVAVERLRLDGVGRPRFQLRTPSGSVEIALALSGAHQATNAAAATAAGLAIGTDLATLASGLEAAQPSPQRMEIHRGRFTVVNDAYNANPDSVRAALRTVAVMPGRHLAVLGMMAELGPIEAEEHRAMGAEARQLGYTAVVVVGDDPGIAEGAGDLAVVVPDQAAAAVAVTGMVAPGDVVLVKASRRVGLDRLAALLAKAAAP
ncbi:MAG: UDP-N-acetylmuramoyl-tripeptide--D-alanyl-D-alanine ligase [Acidimicrobiia bacterium]|nr:UDP-N-acetylmuramoyl-tripeptide--D-alanyl-D-alanine ligase [Acidimicrobiia bacterium]